MDKKIPACYFYSLLNSDVLSYHPSLINQVRFIFFLFPQNPLSEWQNFLCFWQKVKYMFCVFFVCKQTLFTIPAIFIGALGSITSGKTRGKVCQNERPRLSLFFTNQDEKQSCKMHSSSKDIYGCYYIQKSINGHFHL